MARRTFHNRLGELVELPKIATKALGGQMEGLLERLQAPAARKGMEAAFNAKPAALGRAAAEAVRRRR